MTRRIKGLYSSKKYKFMSLGELAIIAIVAIFVIKPEDLPAIMNYIKKARRYFSDLKKEAMASLDKEEPEIMENSEEINYYLQRIISLEGSYEGEYSLDRVKAKYKEIVKKTLKESGEEK